jgi:5-formyltetrahydrofolate cyclo-ligase
LTEAIDAPIDRQALRRRIRRERRAVRGEHRSAAERAISRRIQTLGVYHQARSVAVYLAFDGEPSMQRVVDAALRHGKQVYAPVLLRSGMRFARFGARPSLGRNFFGIDEPAPDSLLDARFLDLVLTPLVAFDRQGVRLGMGRGYYDRAFHFLRHRNHWSRPKLVGVGFSVQCVDQLERQAWDIPLWGAVTERETHRFAVPPP